MHPNIRNPVHWPNFQSPNSHWNLIVSKKALSKSCSSWLLLTPFESKWTYYVMSTDRLNVRRNRNFDHFLCKMAHFQYFAKSSKTPLKLIGQFGVLLKRCQKKRETWTTRWTTFLNIIRFKCVLGIENPVSTVLLGELNSFFWEAVYVV